MSLKPIAKKSVPVVKLSYEEEYQKWADRVLNAAYRILYALSEDKYMDEIIQEVINTDDAYSIWTEAFTAPDVSMVNYERQEFLGDAISQALFAEYTYTKYPNAGPDQLTELKAHYTDNEVQGELLGDLARLARIEEPIESLIRRNESMFHVVPVDMRNDLYESVFSAIYLTGNSYRNGLGYMWCKRFVEVIYDGKIDFEEYSKPSAISRLDNMFVSFGYSENTERVRKPSVFSAQPVVGDDGISRITTTVRVNAEIVSFLNGNFVTGTLTRQQKAFVSKMRKDAVIGTATEMLKKKSRRVAATNALKYIEDNIGLDSEWVRVNKVRYDNIFINKDYDGLADRVIADLKQSGYVTAEGDANYKVDKLTKFTIEGTRTVSRLIGIRPDGRLELLETDAGDGNMFKAKIKLFEKYLERKA